MGKDAKGHGSNGRDAKIIPNSAAKAQGMAALGLARPKPPGTAEYKAMSKQLRHLDSAYLAAKPGKVQDDLKRQRQDLSSQMNAHARERAEGAKKSDAKPSPAVNKKGDTFKPKQSVFAAASDKTRSRWAEKDEADGARRSMKSEERRRR